MRSPSTFPQCWRHKNGDEALTGMTEDERESATNGQRVCPAEHAGWLYSSWRKVIHNPARILRGLVKPGDTAVDLGCGPGFFTLPLAEMVGEEGLVIAVDLQEAMLEKLRARAEQAGLASRIHPHQATTTTMDLVARAEFVLAFYMLHEVPNKERFLEEVREILNEDGRFLLVEPWGHVSGVEYQRTVATAAAVGLKPLSKVRVAFSRGTLFQRG